MRRQFRKEQILKRKNFFPTLLVTMVLWTSTFLLIYFVDPDVFGAVILFFILIFFTLLFTFSLVFANSRRGFLSATSILFFLILSFLGLGNILNLILTIAIAACIELYFSWK